MKYYIESILCPDEKFHRVTYDDTESSIDESQFRGGCGKVLKPLSEIELLFAKLKSKYER